MTLKEIFIIGKEKNMTKQYKLFKTAKEGKHLYNIMQFASIIHTHSERNSIYDEYGNTQVKYKSLMIWKYNKLIIRLHSFWKSAILYRKKGDTKL